MYTFFKNYMYSFSNTPKKKNTSNTHFHSILQNGVNMNQSILFDSKQLKTLSKIAIPKISYSYTYNYYEPQKYLDNLNYKFNFTYSKEEPMVQYKEEPMVQYKEEPMVHYTNESQIIYDYVNKYESFNKAVVYNFPLNAGGLGDCIKFFIFCLTNCIKDNSRIYYKKNNILIEKYLKLKYDKMYINEVSIKQLLCDSVEMVDPGTFYQSYHTNFNINISDVFYFTDEVKLNSKYLMSPDITNYISIHLRLGDRFLETDINHIICKDDVRYFSEEKIFKIIEENYDKNIFFCADNNSYKLRIKERYNNIFITTCDIGHSGLVNTTEKQILDSITEFYILTNSKMIYSGSISGYSLMASKFNGIPIYVLETIQCI